MTAQKPQRKHKFVTLDKESNTVTSILQQREEFLKIYSQKDLAEKVQAIEVTLQSKKVRRHGTSTIQRLSSKIVSGAGNQMGSQSMRLCRLYKC